MRIARSLLVVALGAFLSTAVAVSPAWATNAIEVVDEADATHCSLLTPETGQGSDHTSGGCPVHLEGTLRLEIFLFGVWFLERTCDVEQEGRMGEDGQLAISSMRYFAAESTAESNCSTSPPFVMCNSPWEATIEQVASTVLHAVSPVCLNATEGGTCGSSMEYDIVFDHRTEEFWVDYYNLHIGFPCRGNGRLTFENSTNEWSSIHLGE